MDYDFYFQTLFLQGTLVVPIVAIMIMILKRCCRE